MNEEEVIAITNDPKRTRESVQEIQNIAQRNIGVRQGEVVYLIDMRS